MRDLYSNITAIPALPSASRSAAATGTVIDLKDARRIVFVVNTGASSGDFGLAIEESDTGTSGWTLASEHQTQSDAPAVLAAESVYRLGYLGWKRYVRLALSKAGGTSVQIGAVAVMSPLDRSGPSDPAPIAPPAPSNPTPV